MPFNVFLGVKTLEFGLRERYLPCIHFLKTSNVFGREFRLQFRNTLKFGSLLDDVFGEFRLQFSREFI